MLTVCGKIHPWPSPSWPATVRACRKGILAGLMLAAGALQCGRGYAEAKGWFVGVARARIESEDGEQAAHDTAAAHRWAKAIVFQDATETRQVLVSLAGIDRETARHMTAAIGSGHSLPRQAIVLVSGSADHSLAVSPEAASLQPAVLKLVDAAIAALRPAELAWTVGRAHFAVNRLHNREADVPALRAADRLAGPVDHDVPVLIVREPGLDGSADVRAILAGYACRAAGLACAHGARDWHDYAERELEHRYPKSIALIWQGCGGDQAALPQGTVALAKGHGADLAAAVTAAVERRLVPIQGDLTAICQDLPLAVPPRGHSGYSGNRVQQTPCCGEDPAEPGEAVKDGDREDRKAVLSSVQAWRLGDGPRWVFLRGTPVVNVALRLKAELGCGQTWVAGTGAVDLAIGQTKASQHAIVATVREQIAVISGVAAEPPPAITPPPYPSHADLTVVWDDTVGGVRPIESPADWEQRRSDILAGMQAIMGRLPGDAELGPLTVVERGRDELPGCSRLLLSYAVGNGRFATAHLYLPVEAAAADLLGSDGRRPAVLALHPTSPLGKDVVAGAGPRANRAYGIELAQRGYVVLAPDYPSYGELADYDFQLDPYISGTLAGIVNHRRGVDLLAARPEVDAARIGAIGHSLGGHNAIFIGAFDSRIKGVVSSCGWDPFHAYRDGHLKGWAQDLYMPRVREVAGCNPDCMPFDFPEAVAALAPRGFFSASPLGDHNFSAAAIAAAAPSIRLVYERLGGDGQFVLRQPDCGHDFPPATRAEAYAFLDRVVAGKEPKKGAGGSTGEPSP